MELQDRLKTSKQQIDIDIPDTVSEILENDNHSENENNLEENENDQSVVCIDVETQCNGANDSIDGRKKESNQFASKKATAEGMMDVALLTANANQLRFLIAYNSHSKTYLLIMVLIILSLVLQTVVGFAFICRRYWKCRNDKRKTRLTSEFLVAAVFLVTLINIFVATFSTTD